MTPRWLALGGTLAGLLVGYSLGLVSPGLRADAPKAAVPNPQSQAIDANLYVQTSAEYRACCLTIYRAASARLALLVQPAVRPPLPAVVLDLDETVLDNASFQSYLEREGLPYTDVEWLRFEKDYPDEVKLVPGALGFLQLARQLQVAVVFVSNRSDANRGSTLQALEAVGVRKFVTDENVYLATTTADKSHRREAIAARYNVVMTLGDNLRDFSEAFAAPKPIPTTTDGLLAAIEARKHAVDAAAPRWGVDWFCLPNPVYGEWQKLYGPNPRALLRPSGVKRAGGKG